jgi:hypothetical protein
MASIRGISGIGLCDIDDGECAGASDGKCAFDDSAALTSIRHKPYQE